MYVVSYFKTFLTEPNRPVTVFCNWGHPEDCIYFNCPSDSVWMVPPATFEV